MGDDMNNKIKFLLLMLLNMSMFLMLIGCTQQRNFDESKTRIRLLKDLEIYSGLIIQEDFTYLDRISATGTGLILQKGQVIEILGVASFAGFERTETLVIELADKEKGKYIIINLVDSKVTDYFEVQNGETKPPKIIDFDCSSVGNTNSGSVLSPNLASIVEANEYSVTVNYVLTDTEATQNYIKVTAKDSWGNSSHFYTDCFKRE